MENYQKLEQLVNKTGCSYEDARTALEANGWDMIDAVVSLEREGKVKKETVEKKTEKAIEITAEIAPSADQAGESRQSASDEDGAAGKDSAGGSERKEGKPKREFKLWNRIKRILMNNRMVILKSNGDQFIDLPILAPIIALLLFFWATLGVAVLAMLFGFRFHFEGEDLGKTNINNTMDKATDYAEKVRNDLTGKANE